MNRALINVYTHIFKIWRPRRIKLFKDIIKPKENEEILDVGGEPNFWKNTKIKISRIDLLNTQKFSQPTQNQRPYMRTIVGDACSLPFKDEAYSIVFSNSVIEHVGSYERQQQFAKEIQRVGKRIWVQTPAFIFPMEPHSLMPFLHWLPWRFRKYFLKITPVALMWKGDISPFLEDMKNTKILKKSELKALFPDCTILTEKIFKIFPKKLYCG